MADYTLLVENLLARMMAANGVDFFEDTNIHLGVWTGFMPHNEGCIVSAVIIQDEDGNVADTPTWVGTTLDLDCYISAGLVYSENGYKQGYITSITLGSGAATFLKNVLRKS
jgi:hypothetical protein